MDISPIQPNTPAAGTPPANAAAPAGATPEATPTAPAPTDKAAISQTPHAHSQMTMYQAAALIKDTSRPLAPKHQDVAPMRQPMVVTMYQAGGVDSLKTQAKPPIQKTHFGITVPVQGDEV